MANVIGHFRTITKHRHKVIKHCFKAGIGLQGLRHDLSKYSPTEFFNGVKYYDGTELLQARFIRAINIPTPIRLSIFSVAEMRG